ncbi:MAG: type II and III secretion system protein [Treponema sp.]|jgi:type II secretory pathway component GspD/PulD (secretin)|nr:type II and III secretion system protein [Treponema sp.]
MAGLYKRCFCRPGARFRALFRAGFCAALFFACAAAGAQQIKAMDFRNQSITDILMVLAEASGTSILPDETVRGAASFHFSDSDLMEALDAFLSGYKLFHTRDGNVIRVSRILSGYDRERGRVSLKAEDVGIENLVKALAKTINTSILYDPLPDVSLSVDIDNLEVKKALDIIMLKLTDFVLTEDEAWYYIRRQPAGNGEADASERTPRITREGDLYSVSAERGRFQELVTELFRAGEKEYSVLTKADSVLENLYFSGKDFEGLLRIILEQGNADYVLNNGIYYIVELQRRDVLKKLKETVIIPLRHIPAQEFPSLLPAEYSGNNLLKIDKNTNTVILTGTAEEIAPVRNFLESVDRPAEGLEYHRFELKYLPVEDFLSMAPQKLLPITPAVVPQSNAFIVQGAAETIAALAGYIGAVDKKEEGYPVELKYIKIDELLKNLPPSVTKDDISDSGYPNLLFFTGPREKRELFVRELALIDKPRPQIRYELLVIEYMKNNETRFGGSLGASRAEEGASPGASFLGNLSSVMNLSFDVVAQFGYQFALNLSAQLAENLAQVYADTTLNGLSGQEIRFQNTDTFRYQEFEVDASTGNLSRTGVTREISSGLIVALNGWVSGDNMITMSVNATVSKQNNNPSIDSTAIPSTSERVVNTHIRTLSGKPVILSGLIKETTDKTRKKVPGLGSIPLFKNLFGESADANEKTEIVIYIVPYLVMDEGEDRDMNRRLERYYRTLAAEYAR